MLAATPEWQRLLVLAPAFVVAGGIVLAVVIVLGRELKQSISDSNHKGWIYAGLAVTLVMIAIMTVLGIQLPKEG